MTSALRTPRPAPPRVLEALAEREKVSDYYWSRKDPINELRMWWRAQTVRHLFHILPGETILDLGCGQGAFSRALARTTRGECPITAASFVFSPRQAPLHPPETAVQTLHLTDFPGPLAGKQFDYVVGNNLLDLDNASWLLQQFQQLLRPGGRLLLFEANPWNPMLRFRQWMGRCLPFQRRRGDRRLPNQLQLYELLSELGFIRVAATPYDFLYPPIPHWLMFLARNLSLVFENTPVLRRLAGAILVHAQMPPRDVMRPPISLVEHQQLLGAVSVIVPCHNEEMNIGPLVEGLLAHYGPYLHELVLIDDNSKDGTRRVLEELAAREPRVKPIFREPPNGVGRALRDGLRQATGRYVLTMDCDFLHILPELRDLFDAVAAGNDVALGSRFSRESVLINYPLQKILCNRAFHLLASLLFQHRIRDFTNNLKLLKREVVDNLDLEADWFAANAETGLKPVLMGYQVRGVPISWINRTPDMGSSSFSLLKNGWGYVKVLSRLAWRTRLGFSRLPRPAERAGLRPGVALAPLK